ncbi:hypothetical protein ABZ260_32615, partial [Streptosporangium sp. NPDC006013]|uniref:hypothetical protein n=1 Tax=Streptosporangium sp. NPDC006013 TaxID=3155596 RepID=UPI0033B4A60A
MRRLPGITVVAALAVLVSAVPAQAAHPGDQVTRPRKRPAPATTATSSGTVAGTVADTPPSAGTGDRKSVEEGKSVVV